MKSIYIKPKCIIGEVKFDNHLLADSNPYGNLGNEDPNADADGGCAKQGYWSCE